MARQRPLFLALSCLLVASSVLAEMPFYGRELLRSKKDLAEEARREDALEAYYLQQATLNKEHEHMLRFGEEEAVPIVKKFEKLTRTKQTALLSDLWENAKGITIVKVLAILIDLNPKDTEYFYAVNSDAMDQAEANGYGFKVSEAVYNAMAVTDAASSHYHLLDALLYRMAAKDKKTKGAGCQYIQFLFSDAEAWAIEDGRTQHFVRGFDNSDYLPLTECYLPVCKGTAAKCCAQKQAVSTGLCGCEVIDKKEGTLRCDHNLFWTAPRTIWLCGTQDCVPDEKCLCPDEKDLKKLSKKKSSKSKSNKKSSKAKNQGKGDDDSEESKEVSKKSKSESKGKKGAKSNRAEKNKKSEKAARKGVSKKRSTSRVSSKRRSKKNGKNRGKAGKKGKGKITT